MNTQPKSRPFQLCDIVREIAFAIHRYHGPGHLEKVYENALVHRLRKHGLRVEQQVAMPVFDEDGTLLGDLFADVVVEGVLLLELKAAKTVIPEHIETGNRNCTSQAFVALFWRDGVRIGISCECQES